MTQYIIRLITQKRWQIWLQ